MATARLKTKSQISQLTRAAPWFCVTGQNWRNWLVHLLVQLSSFWLFLFIHFSTVLLSGYTKYWKPNKTCPSLTHLRESPSPHPQSEEHTSGTHASGGTKPFLSEDETLCVMFAGGGGASVPWGAKPPHCCGQITSQGRVLTLATKRSSVGRSLSRSGLEQGKPPAGCSLNTWSLPTAAQDASALALAGC